MDPLCRFLWWIPNGDTPERIRNHPALQGVDLPNTGQTSKAITMVTKTLLVTAEGGGGEPRLHAVDKTTGQPCDEFGTAVSVDGDWLAVGAPDQNVFGVVGLPGGETLQHPASRGIGQRDVGESGPELSVRLGPWAHGTS